MNFKKFGRRMLAVLAAGALILALAGCGGTTEPLTSAPNSSTQPIGTPKVTATPEPTGMSPSPTAGESGNAHATTVPGNANAKTSFKAGTYTGKAMGKNGDVTVEVVFSDTAIVSVQVTNHSETEGLYEKPVEQIPQEIVGSQSLNVDIVSGATYTSNAIIEAVASCVTQAGGDVDALKSSG